MNNILLVENNPADAELLTDILKTNSLNVIHAATLTEAIQTLVSYHADIILLDLNLDDSNGMETVKKMRVATELPIIVMTGLNDEQIGVESLRNGAQDYLVKLDNYTGFRIPLMRAIRHAIERQQQRITELKLAHEMLLQSHDQLEQLTTELKRSNEELEQFAYVASHDLKAPLRAIGNLVTWIIEDTSKGKSVTEYREKLNSRLKRMETLIDGLLEYSRIGRTHTDSELCSVNTILTDIAEEHPETQIIFTGLPTIRGNKVRIGQIFRNIIGNSIKHHNTPENIKIYVTSFPSQDRPGVTFCIADNGPGIDPKFHDKVFQIFQTLKPKDEIEGTGMGLAIVKKIINHYKGNIWIVSEIGKGCEIFFTIPEIR